MNINQAMKFKVIFMGAKEDDMEKLEVISTLQDEVRRLRALRQQAPAVQEDAGKPRPWLLALAEQCGARITGKPDASEPIEIVFSVQAWRKFDAASHPAPVNTPEPVAYMWVEYRHEENTHIGPGEYSEEVCFDTLPPIDGTKYVPLYPAPAQTGEKTK